MTMMHFIPFNINRAEWAGGAEVLAGTAADALVLIDGGHLMAFVVNHLDGSRGAMTGAVAARNAIGQNNAVVLHPNGMADMDSGLLLTGNGLDGTSGTNLAASRTFRTAIAALE